MKVIEREKSKLPPSYSTISLGFQSEDPFVKS